MNVAQLLLVDDDQNVLSTLAHALGDVGSVDCCDSLEEAKKLVTQKKYDLLITDYRFTGGTGHDLARSLRYPTPVILITGFCDKDVAIRSIDLKIVALLEKPFDAQELLQQVRKHLPSLEDRLHFDESTRSITLRGKKVSLTQTEYAILSYLSKKTDQPVPRSELETVIWGEKSVSKNTLDTHFYNLKNKLPELKERLLAIHGTGFVLKMNSSASF